MNEHPPFSVTILGNASAVPTAHSNLSAQLIAYGRKRFLVDCGEGTQHQLFKLHLKQSHIDHILISHLHGDHFYGIFGLISTFHLFGREKTLHLYAPAPLEKLISQVLEASQTQLRYPLLFHALEDLNEDPLYQDDQLVIKCFPVSHRIATWGFLFRETRKIRKINKKFIESHQPSISHIKAIKAGDGYITSSGTVLSHLDVTDAPPKSRSYAYCADTAYHEPIIPEIFKADLIYHEATFDNSMQQLAQQKYHSTAQQAAVLAKKAEVGQLLLGHFSARHKDLTTLLQEAKAIFPSTEISIEGVTYKIGK